MRRISQVLVFAVFVFGGASFAGAQCGDGVINGAEQCDPGAPGSQVSCPGRCVPLPFLDACKCAVLSSDPADFAAIADLQARLAPHSSVINGGVAVVTAGGLLSVASGASIHSDAQAVADRCKLLPGSSVGRLFCNDDLILPGAVVGNGGPFSFPPPAAFPSLPPFSIGFGGGTDIVVPAGSTQYLAPGAYGKILVEKDGTLILHGLNANSGAGRYDVRGVKVVSGGMLLADNPVVVHIETNLRITGNAVLAPNPTTDVQAGDVQVNVEGRGAKLGKGAFVQARVRAPNGKIAVGRGTIAGGQFIAQKIIVQKEATLRLQGGCGDGEKQATEPCDTSAPNGDGVCPGNCIPLGEAGQCSCRCTSNAECNDQNACNGVETCQNGHCALGTPLDCDDGNSCTNDCNPATGCVTTNVADGTSCSDDNECTRQDKCQAGVCQPGTPRVCNDGNDCTADSCDPEHGCEHDPVLNGTACSDGDACTVGEVCVQGQCKNASPKDCNDLNPCTADSCDRILGCQHTPLANGASCAGSNPCTALDACNNGACTSGLTQLCGASDACTIVSCTATGPVGNQTAECKSTAAVDCNDLNPCTIDTCHPQNGCQHAPVVNGSSCAGPSPCTALDVCNAGQCTSGVPQLCSDGNPCTTETCTVQGPVGAQSAHCNYAPRPNNTSCGPNGQVCTNSVCQ